MTRLLDELIFGERLGDLLPVLRKIRDESVISDSGRLEFDIRLEPVEREPFARALLRAESATLLDEAEAIGTPSETDRTPAQRRADAFLLLMQRIGTTQPTR
jgi:hypothetical protein